MLLPNQPPVANIGRNVNFRDGNQVWTGLTHKASTRVYQPMTPTTQTITTSQVAMGSVSSYEPRKKVCAEGVAGDMNKIYKQ